MEWKHWINFLARNRLDPYHLAWHQILVFHFPPTRRHMCFTWIWKLFFSFHVVWQMETFNADCWRRAVGVLCYLSPRVFPSAHARSWSREATTLGTRIPILYQCFLVSCWAHGETRGYWMSFSQKNVWFQLHCYACNQSITFKLHYPRLSPDAQPLTKNPVNSGSGYLIQQQHFIQVFSNLIYGSTYQTYCRCSCCCYGY